MANEAFGFGDGEGPPKDETRIPIEVESADPKPSKYVDYTLKHQHFLLWVLYIFDVVTELANEVRHNETYIYDLIIWKHSKSY